MSLFHTNGKNSCFTEDVRFISLQSSHQDSSLEDAKTNKEGKPSSSQLPTHSGAIQMKKSPAMTCQKGERRLVGQFSPSSGQRITILADKV